MHIHAYNSTHEIWYQQLPLIITDYIEYSGWGLYSILSTLYNIQCTDIYTHYNTCTCTWHNTIHVRTTYTCTCTLCTCIHAHAHVVTHTCIIVTYTCMVRSVALVAYSAGSNGVYEWQIIWTHSWMLWQKKSPKTFAQRVTK